MGASIGKLSSLLKALLPHQRTIDGDEECHQRLVRADVRGCLLTADMLLTGLKGEHKSTLVAIILGHANDTSGHLPDEFLRAAQVAHVWTAQLHGDAQRLPVAHGNVCAPLAWRLQHGEIGSHAIHDKQCLVLMTSIGNAAIVLNNSKHVWLLNHNACNAVER